MSCHTALEEQVRVLIQRDKLPESPGQIVREMISTGYSPPTASVPGATLQPVDLYFVTQTWLGAVFQIDSGRLSQTQGTTPSEDFLTTDAPGDSGNLERALKLQNDGE